MAGSLSYLVFRDIKCDDSRRWDVRRTAKLTGNSKLFWEESIGMISEDLKSCVDGIAHCGPHVSAYYSNSDDYGYNGYAPPRYANESERDVYEIRFFYHHFDALTATIPSLASPLKEEVEDLLEFLQETHGAAYSETNKLAAQGLAHRDHLEMLFCPNDVVVTRQHGSLSAFVLRVWPSGDSILDLDCWSWAYDGQWFHRKNSLRTITRPLKRVVPIRDLEVYPLRFATDEEKNELLLRGRKFWSLRYKNLASYEGWDFKAEQSFVRPLLSLLIKK
jgi:hypothetical protein